MGKPDKRLKTDRVGQERYNNKGSLMRIVKYRKGDDIDILFPEYDYIAKNKQYSNFVRGSINCPYERTVNGVGYLGEGEAIVSIGRKNTDQYDCWKRMLKRCYNEKFHIKSPTYTDCSVCEEWHNYQNFYKWYNQNYYEIPGEIMCLDKDILIKGNKEYGPNACIFVPQRINNLFIKRDKCRGDLPIGVCINKRVNRYIASSNDRNNQHIHLGYFDSPTKAFDVYKEYKENLIKSIADDYYNKGLIPIELYEAMYNWSIDIDD